MRSAIAELFARRLLAVVPVLFGISLLAFFVIDVLPGSAAQLLLGVDATPEQVARLEAEMGLARGPGERYLDWLSGVLTGDLGESLASRQPVSALLRERLPVTLQLAAYALVLALALGMPTALTAARWLNTLWDRLSAVVSIIALAVPSYVLAIVLVLVFSIHLKMFPSMGFTPLSESVSGNLRTMTLPALAIAIPLLGLYTRFLRGDLLEQMHAEDYVTTAVAKGIGPWRVLLYHVFRNSVFGLLAIVGLNIGTLISSTVIVEQIFALSGVGQLLLHSIHTRDAEVVQALVLLFAVMTVVANLCVDLLHAMLDPRIRHGLE